MKIYVRSSVDVTDKIREEFIKKLKSEFGWSKRECTNIADNYISSDLFKEMDINSVDDAVSYVKEIAHMSSEDVQELIDEIEREHPGLFERFGL